ncbi:hypothetical protein ACFFON_06590 [Arthrobacter citreus]
MAMISALESKAGAIAEGIVHLMSAYCWTLMFIGFKHEAGL